MGTSRFRLVRYRIQQTAFKRVAFSDDDKKYDLEPEKFVAFKQNSIKNVNKLHANEIMQANNDSGNLRDILQE